MRTQQFSVGPINDIEKAILWGLHDHFALSAVDVEINERHILGRSEIPVISRDLLVVPIHASGVGIDRHDRGGKEIIAAARTSNNPCPGRRVAHTEIDLTQFGIVNN